MRYYVSIEQGPVSCGYSVRYVVHGAMGPPVRTFLPLPHGGPWSLEPDGSVRARARAWCDRLNRGGRVAERALREAAR